MQNKLHIKALESIIDDDIPIYSIIAFSERCTLKDIAVTDSRIKVINRNNISKAVNQLSSLTNTKISISDVDSIASKLYPLSQVTDYIKQKHIENINLAHQTQPQLPKNVTTEADKESVVSDNGTVQASDSIGIADDKCPLCGSRLVLRTAKKGANAGKQFYGCSAFPKCRYIKNI